MLVSRGILDTGRPHELFKQLQVKEPSLRRASVVALCAQLVAIARDSPSGLALMLPTVHRLIVEW